MEATRRELTNKKLASFRAVLKRYYCHFRSPCKNGDNCKFRHEDSPRCEQDKDCADRVCQFKHSGTSEPQKAQSLGARVVMGEATVPLKLDPSKRQQVRPGFDYWNCDQFNDCANQRCQLEHSEELTIRKKRLRKFCHFFNNQNSCKKGEECRFLSLIHI